MALPVSVSTTSFGLSGVIPRQVALQIGFYQIDAGRIILIFYS
jgi:hypothetical protein